MNKRHSLSLKMPSNTSPPRSFVRRKLSEPVLPTPFKPKISSSTQSLFKEVYIKIYNKVIY